MHVGGTAYNAGKAFNCVSRDVLLAKLHFIAFKEQVQIGSDPI